MLSSFGNNAYDRSFSPASWDSAAKWLGTTFNVRMPEMSASLHTMSYFHNVFCLRPAAFAITGVYNMNAAASWFSRNTCQPSFFSFRFCTCASLNKRRGPMKQNFRCGSDLHAYGRHCGFLFILLAVLVPRFPGQSLGRFPGQPPGPPASSPASSPGLHPRT